MSSAATLKMRTTASVTSGPMPSPGMSVITWLIESSQAPFCARQCRESWREQRRDRLRAARDRPAPNAAGRSLSMSISPRTRVAVHDRHDDLRLRLDAARQIPRIGVDVVDDDRPLLGGGGAADAAAERNARVRRRLAEERAEHQLVAVDQVDADPRVVRDRLLEHFDRARPWPATASVAGADGGARPSRRTSSWCVRQSFISQKMSISPPRIGTSCRPVAVACRRPNSTRRGSASRKARRGDADFRLRAADLAGDDDARVDGRGEHQQARCSGGRRTCAAADRARRAPGA